MKRLLRWGRSAYETDADLALEAGRLEDLGLEWLSVPTKEPPYEALAKADILVVTSGVQVTGRVLDTLRGHRANIRPASRAGS